MRITAPKKWKMTNLKSYEELILLPTFKERFDYLKLNGVVAEPTFGSKRWLNQVFYTSREWKNIRNEIIIRDLGCDLGIPGREITNRIMIHHINPITEDDILQKNFKLIDPNNLITTMKRTHDAIHYGDENQLLNDPISRSPNDMIPWK